MLGIKSSILRDLLPGCSKPVLLALTPPEQQAARVGVRDLSRGAPPQQRPGGPSAGAGRQAAGVSGCVTDITTGCGTRHPGIVSADVDDKVSMPLVITERVRKQFGDIERCLPGYELTIRGEGKEAGESYRGMEDAPLIFLPAGLTRLPVADGGESRFRTAVRHYHGPDRHVRLYLILGDPGCARFSGRDAQVRGKQ